MEVFTTIENDITVFSGFFHVTNVSQGMETFLLIVGSFILAG
jgi:hypothetical protein